ncbi:hypothetical protein LCM10_12510 [Rossellomorea aquimaris]|uniref:hypothetical protein n=1 Tax=Rossellomorea aquimaris TaxID=189382 RepID=UPI001CD730FF|nr:hypothetical protein [Rossellomorea aquimaris]MCA1055811.1 hypothetical protein [Rossellomorea aquimaris]
MMHTLRTSALFIGYCIAALFIFEMIGEFSPAVEGVFHTFNIQWRYPILVSILSFGLVYWIDGHLSKPLLIGMLSFVLGIGAFVVIYFIALVTMTFS